MKICAVNGSPRKNGNTAEVLRHALEGAMSVPEISTKMIHVSGIKFSACTSCFECKRMGSKSYGKCAINDGLTPVIEELSHADGIIFGSPVYFGNITGKIAARNDTGDVMAQHRADGLFNRNGFHARPFLPLIRVCFCQIGRAHV